MASFVLGYFPGCGSPPRPCCARSVLAYWPLSNRVWRLPNTLLLSPGCGNRHPTHDGRPETPHPAIAAPRRRRRGREHGPRRGPAAERPARPGDPPLLRLGHGDLEPGLLPARACAAPRRPTRRPPVGAPTVRRGNAHPPARSDLLADAAAGRTL